MRVASFSDLHGDYKALKLILAAIDTEAADLILNLGDAFAGNLYPRETLDLLKTRPVLTVRGNHERLMAAVGVAMPAPDRFAIGTFDSAEMAWLAELPHVLRPRFDILAVHGIVGDDTIGFLETAAPTGLRPASDAELTARLGTEEAALILCGHTHVPRAVRRSNGQLIVCPGSACRPLVELNPSLGIEWSEGLTCYLIADDCSGAWRAELVVLTPKSACRLQLS